MMPVTISLSETQYLGLTTPSAEEPPIWGVVFQINREDGIGTAIGITVRCDHEADARAQALSKLQEFLSEASAATLSRSENSGVSELSEPEGGHPA